MGCKCLHLYLCPSKLFNRSPYVDTGLSVRGPFGGFISPTRTPERWGSSGFLIVEGRTSRWEEGADGSISGLTKFQWSSVSWVETGTGDGGGLDPSVLRRPRVRGRNGPRFRTGDGIEGCDKRFFKSQVTPVTTTKLSGTGLSFDLPRTGSRRGFRFKDGGVQVRPPGTCSAKWKGSESQE